MLFIEDCWVFATCLTGWVTATTRPDNTTPSSARLSLGADMRPDPGLPICA